MKLQEPTKGVRIRRLLEKAGFRVFLVNEFRTSCMCSNGCGMADLSKMSKITTEKIDFYGETQACDLYSLFKCKTCNNMWNRNGNSSLNIHDITLNALNKIPRPIYLTRNLKLKEVKKMKKTDCISQI